MSLWRWVLAIYLGVMFLVAAANSLCMIVSPQVWFRLPKWIRLSGQLTGETHRSGWGAVQVRLLGAVLLSALIWAVLHWR